MLPEFLDSTYKKYKQDTSVFVEWLSENAQKCGWKTNNVPDIKQTAAAATAPRLKGKARKLAKQATPNDNATGPSSRPTPKSRRFVNSKDLLPQAKAIAESKAPTIEVPIAIIRAGLGAVSARKRCTNYFENYSTDDAKTRQQNDSHSYFTGLMEEVLLTLQPRIAVSAGDNSTTNNSPQTSKGLESLENRFAALEIEEPAEQREDGTAITSPVELLYEIEPANTKNEIENEKLFALFCLFEDFHRLRVFVMETWVDYFTDKVDLITASVVTNAAFEFAIQTSDELLASYPDCVEYDDVLSTILKALVKSQDLPNEVDIEIDDDVASFIYVPEHSILESFCEVLQPRRVPLMKRGHFGVYDPRADRSKMSTVEKNQRDLILTMEILPEFCFLAKYNIKLLASDEFTRGLSKMAITKLIPVWLPFALTIFLDIHHLGMQHVDIPFNNLKVIADKAKNTLSQYFEFSQGLTSPETWPYHNERVLQQFANNIDETVLKDPIFPHKKGLYAATDPRRPFSDENERFYLYKRHPILCGLISFWITLEMQNFGVTLVQGWGTAIYPAHFYNAIRQQTRPVSWPLMDEVIALHGEDRIFVGGTPRTMSDCYKQVNLVLGVSPQSFARNRRQNKVVVSKNGPRGLDTSSPLCDMLRTGLETDGSSSFTLYNVEKFLNDQALDAALAANPQNKSLRNEWKRSHRLTSIQFLEALGASIPIELPKLRVDYFRLHEQSINLLRRLRTELDGDLKAIIGNNYIENESQLPFVGLWVIHVACGTESTAQELGISEAGSRLLLKASTVFDTFMGEQQ